MHFRDLLILKQITTVFLLSMFNAMALSAPVPPNLVLSPLQGMQQDIIEGFVGHTIDILVRATDPAGEDDRISITTSSLPRGVEYLKIDDHTGTLSWTAVDHVSQRVTLTAVNRNTGLSVSQTITLVANLNRAPVFKSTLPQNADVVVGKSIKVLLSVEPDFDDDSVVISAQSALPKGAKLGKTYQTAEGEWVAEFNWLPRLNQVGSYHAIFLATDDSPLGPSQSQYDIDIEVRAHDSPESDQVKSVSLTQASLRLGKDRSQSMLKVSGQVASKRATANSFQGTATLYHSANGNIIAKDIAVDRHGHFTYAGAISEVEAPCFIQAEVDNKLSYLRRVKRRPQDGGCYLVSQRYPATSIIDAQVNLDARVRPPSETPFTGPDLMTGEIDPGTFNILTTFSVYDSLTNIHELTVYFVKSAESNGAVSIWYLYAFLDRESLSNDNTPVPLGFDSIGKLRCFGLSCASGDYSSVKTSFDFAKAFGPKKIGGYAAPMSLTFIFKNSTQLQQHFSVQDVSIR